MPFKIVRNDITKMKVDIIVNSANPEAKVGGGLDFAIHEAGGKELIDARIKLGTIPTGDLNYTKGYNLDAKYIIHTVGPIWTNGNDEERKLLYNCYYNSLLLAKELNCSSIALPLISAGSSKCPIDTSIEIANKAIKDFLQENEMYIYLVVFDHDSYIISKVIYNRLSLEIESFINTSVVMKQRARGKIRRNINNSLMSYEDANSLEDELNNITGTFQEMLFKHIIRKGYNDPEVYKRANVDRKHFAKIRKNKYYHPSKNTALALAIALRLTISETEDLIARAGYSFSPAMPNDIIIKYFINNENYNIYDINEALFDFKQELLGV